MGSGRSGIYYTTHGSRMIHHKALIHSLEGDYTTPSKEGVPIRLKSGGHGQAAISNSKGSKKDLLTRFDHTKYYRFYREEVALMPKEQEIFQNIFEKHGIAEKPAYTRFTEKYNWESTVSK